jgi:NifU-like protein involved in Fe-S cluster formation
MYGLQPSRSLGVMVMTASSSRIWEYVQDRRHVGELSCPTRVGHSSLDGQPPHTTLHLRIDKGVVRDGRFRTSGCGFMLACCAAMIELSLECTLDECRRIERSQIANHLRGLPDNRLYCAELAVAALQDALRIQPSPLSPLASDHCP